LGIDKTFSLLEGLKLRKNSHFSMKLAKSIPQGLKRLRKNSGFRVKSAESVSPGLKPTLFCWLYAGVETPASLRTEFFRSL